MEHPVVLFDGVCNLCNGAVLWIIRRDPEAKFRFAPLQSRPDLAGLPDSIVLIDSCGTHVRSEAVLRIALGLRSPWPLLGAIGRVFPRPVRDGIYNFVARRRYRWFGKQDECVLPTPELRARFIDSDQG